MFWEPLGRRILPKKKPFTISVEGNVGVGKSKLLNQLKQQEGVFVIEEPVSQWQNVRKGINLLQLMYQDPRRWGFTFQSQVQLTMLQMHTMPCPESVSVKIMERSLHSARYCFVENLFQAGLMADAEKTVLDEWYQWLSRESLLDVDLVLYLRASPETVYSRVQDRGRKEEQGVSLDLLKRLHELHDDWLLNHAFPIPAPVMVLDGEKPSSEVFSQYKKCTDQIQEISSLQ